MFLPSRFGDMYMNIALNESANELKKLFYLTEISYSTESVKTKLTVIKNLVKNFYNWLYSW